MKEPEPEYVNPTEYLKKVGLQQKPGSEHSDPQWDWFFQKRGPYFGNRKVKKA